MGMGLTLVIALLVWATPASAGSYRWIAPDGSVSYSDQRPPANATIAPPPDMPVAPPVAPPQTLETERPAPGRPATVEEILELSGVTRQVGAMSATLVAEFKAPESFSAKERAAVTRVAESQLHADRLLAIITAELRRRHDQQGLDAAAAWLRSPLGRKITAAEIAASLAPEAERRAGVSSASRARTALIEQLDWLGGITESQLDTIVAITRATAMSIADVLPPDQRRTPAQIERDLQRRRAQARAQVEQATIQFMLYHFLSLEDAYLVRFE
jgi:hypothetical protein